MLKRALALPLLLAIAVAANAQTEPPPSGSISVNVDLVVLHVTVRNRHGAFAPDLREQDFQVFDDGVPQPIRLFRHEDIPVTVGLVVDHSGSMRPKLAEVITAARTFVHSSNPDDEMFVVNFNERVTLGLPTAMPFTNRADQLDLAILRGPVTGETALYDAVAEGLTQLRAGARDKKVLIVISDGGDNSSRLPLDAVLKMAGESTALLYTIGIFDIDDKDRKPDVLRRLARATGGEAFFPLQVSGVVSICESIARDIRNQYTIAYDAPGSSQPGAYRSVRVTAAAPGAGKLSVLARTGYIAAGPQ
jgi:Ca-activated chloride channel family protein